MSIFGVRMAQDQAVAGALPLPTSLAGATAAIAGCSLPLLFSSANQSNAMIPYDLPINATHQMVVRRGTAISIRRRCR